MTFSVYQHWDPLKVCIVGRSYPPEFYSWIKVPHVRKLFERIATETEEDFQLLIKKLEEFGVEVLRPDLPTEQDHANAGKFILPPMTPRDYTAMIGNKFYSNYHWSQAGFATFYRNVKDTSWPECWTTEEFLKLPQHIQDECWNIHQMEKFVSKEDLYATNHAGCYDKIFKRICNEGNTMIPGLHVLVNGAMVSRIGKDLYFGSDDNCDPEEFKKIVNKEFINTRNHFVDTSGHSDGAYCPVCPGLIISLFDIPCYAETFPGWEVIYLPGQSWGKVKPFLDLKEKNKGKWWIPGFEYDQDVIDVVENWLGHWVGYVEETVFDINMLIIDPKNVIVFGYNKQVFDALDRYGITPHIVPFRHRYFWDGGVHCVTSDLHREGTMQDYFSQRG